MGPRKKSGGGGNQASGSKQASGVTCPSCVFWCPNPAEPEHRTLTGAGPQPASFSSSHTWLGSRRRSQEPAHGLDVNSGPVRSWQPPPLPFSLPPSPRKRVSQLVGGVSIPHLRPLGGCGGGDRRGPTETLCLPDPPPLLLAGAGKSPVFLEREAPSSSTFATHSQGPREPGRIQVV